jgi:phosphate transport system protein
VSDRHLDREISKLKRESLALGAMIEEGLFKSFKAYELRSLKLSEEVIAADEAINEREVEIEESCLKALALYHPSGSELRMIVALMKIANDLERIGNRAVGIAWQAHSLSYLKPCEVPKSMSDMAVQTKRMLRLSLESLINLNIASAREVLAADDEIDAMNREHFEWVRKAIEAKPTDTEALLSHLLVSRGLERIADHATNVAEDVIYLIEGEIVRHGRSRSRTKSAMA